MAFRLPGRATAGAVTVRGGNARTGAGPADGAALAPDRQAAGRRGSRRVPVRVLLVLAAVAGGLSTVPSAAGAPQPSIAEVQRRVVRLQQDAEVATEKYNDARQELASVTIRVQAAQVRLERQRAEVADARNQLGRLAVESYRRGPYSAFDWVLGDDPRSAMAQAGILPSLGERQAGAVKRLQDGERRLARIQADLAAQQRKLQETKTRLQLHRNDVTRRLLEAQNLLATLKAQERATVLAAARTPGTAGPGGTLTCNTFAVRAPDARVKAVLQFACSQVGDPYVWAGEGPNIWDCSGLTMQAWRQAGVSIPHSSRIQATYGQRVTIGGLQPGDLVFFHSPISHVGIYLGAGMMVHAPRTGDVVKVARLFETPSAAVRL
jgi:cell wall-associated NlpC family hydrolase